jgi:hypothetical protein
MALIGSVVFIHFVMGWLLALPMAALAMILLLIGVISARDRSATAGRQCAGIGLLLVGMIVLFVSAFMAASVSLVLAISVQQPEFAASHRGPSSGIGQFLGFWGGWLLAPLLMNVGLSLWTNWSARVIDESGRLRVRLTGQAFLPAFHAGNDRFFLKVVPAELQFGRGATGEVVSLTLHQNGRQISAKKTATPAPAVFFPKAEELAAYGGRYQLAPGAVFEIVHHGAVLTAKLTGQPAFPVHNDAPDHFVYDVVDAALTFERDATGAVTAVVLHRNGADRRCERIE